MSFFLPRPSATAPVLRYLRVVGACVLLVTGLIACDEGPSSDLGGPRTLGATDEPAVVRLLQGRAMCSGALIAPRVVLTARHCVPARSDAVLVQFNGEPPIASARAEVAPTADLALLLLERPAPAGVTPLLLPQAAAAPPARKTSARLVGFGVSGGGRGDESPKHTADVLSVDDDDGHLYFRAAPKAVCGGDSGGPVLLRDGAGERLIAVAASTLEYERQPGAQCAAILTGTRVDRHLPFIAGFVARARDGAANLGDGCYFDGHCAAGLTCDANAGPRGVRVCTRPCDAVQPCPPGMTCAASRCIASAAPTAPTAAPTSAAPAAPAAPAACHQDGDCQSGVCSAASGADKRCLQRCYPEAATTCPAGTACIADRDAPARYLCVSGAQSGEEGESEGWPASKIIYMVLLGVVVFALLGRLSARRKQG